jgi:tRNA(Ile)-lysidine synthase
MAGSGKRRSAEAVGAAAARALESGALRGKRLVVGLSGGLDSVVLLHALQARAPECGIALRALHVHHGMSPNADGWARFCRALCRRLGVRFSLRRVKVARRGKGVEAAARDARYSAYRSVAADAVLLAHHLDDQAETVLMNLLRGAGARGASGMPGASRLDARRLLVRPLLEVPREAILAYAREHGLAWIEDESNADERLTRNFLRRRVAPLLAERFPRWREALARAARHFARTEADARLLLREFLASHGLRAPSEAKLVEMLKQLAAGGTGTLLQHDGAALRLYRGKVHVAPARIAHEKGFSPVAWKGEARLPIPSLGGEIRFRRVRGEGMDESRLRPGACTIRTRSGGERLQPDARRPGRTLKNLFQEAGVPAWERERLPLLFCGEDLVWVPGLGIDARYQAPKGSAGVVPEWHRL